MTSIISLFPSPGQQTFASRYLSQGASHRFVESYFHAEVKHVKHSMLSSPWQESRITATRQAESCEQPKLDTGLTSKWAGFKSSKIFWKSSSKNFFSKVLQSTDKRGRGCKAPFLQQLVRWVKFPVPLGFVSGFEADSFLVWTILTWDRSVVLI